MSSSLISRVIFRASALNAARSARTSLTVPPVVVSTPTWTRAFVTTSPASLATAKTATTKSKTSSATAKTAGPRKAAGRPAKKPAKKPVKKAATKPVKKVAPKKVQELKPTTVYKRNRPPKRPSMSSYAVFFGEHMKKSLSDKPFQTNMKEVCLASGEAWKALSDSEKQHYVREAEKINASRHEEWQNYQNNMDPKTKRVLNEYLEGKQKRQLPRKSRKLTGYAQFLKDEASSVQAPADVEGLGIGAYKFRALAERWHAMSDSEKQVYFDRAAKGRAEPAQHPEL